VCRLRIAVPGAAIKHRLALFDLDHTLLPLDSDHAWGRYTTGLGWTDADAFSRANDAFYDQYQAGTLDLAEYIRFTTAALRERGEAAANEAHAGFMRDVIQPALRDEARALVQRHKDEGATVLVVTATNEFVTRPIAEALGADGLIAVDLERDASGWITGAILGVPSFRDGKVHRVEAWLADRGWGWADVHSTFYSDSINDLPLLERVDEPVATNPDARLRAIATDRGWPILDLFPAP
jgi:HAD superfamily hydrolase (TIGR01490 family)